MSDLAYSYADAKRAFGSGYAWRVGGEYSLDRYYSSKVSHVMYDSLDELYKKEPLIWLHDRCYAMSPSAAHCATPLFAGAKILLENKAKIAGIAAIALASGWYLSRYAN